MASDNNSAIATPWFGISMALIGVIVGYSVAANTGAGGGSGAPGPSPTVANVPSVPDTPPPPSGTPPTVDDDPILGDEDAKVTLVEFTDYQCPFCQRHFQQTYGQIKSEYVDTGKIKLVVRDYPLSFHPFAQKAAEASECAHDQGKFWEMHDKLFTGNPIWSNSTDAVPTFKQYAADLKLDTTKFNDCLDKGTKAAEVSADLNDGSASGINGTPGFWVIGPDGKGQMISGAVPFSNFKSVIDGML